MGSAKLERGNKMSCKSCSGSSMCSARCPKCASKKLAHEAGSHYCYVCGDFTAGHSLPGCNAMGTVKASGPYRETMLNGLSVAEKHQLAVAKKNLKTPEAILKVMGWPTYQESRAIIERLEPKRKRSSGLNSRKRKSSKKRRSSRK